MRAALQAADGTPSEALDATNDQRYSHFLAQDAEPLLLGAAALPGQAELLLVVGVLLLQRLQLSGGRAAAAARRDGRENHKTENKNRHQRR